MLAKWIQKLEHCRRDEKQLMTTKCLYEFQDLALAREIVMTIYPRYSIEGSAVFLDVRDVDCPIISFFLDILTSLNHNATITPSTFPSLKPHKPLVITQVYVGMSIISAFGLRRICASLMQQSSPITELVLYDCGITDDCAQSIADLLRHGNITVFLGMGVNKMTDVGFEIVHKAIIDEKCCLEKLSVMYNELGNRSLELLGESLVKGSCRLKKIKANNNDRITENCKVLVKKMVENSCPDVELLV